MEKIGLIKKELIQVIAEQILKCYYSNGNLVEDYYYNITLPDITMKELECIEELANGNFN